MQQHPVNTLFLDIGGVLLTNGWGASSRELAAKKFDLDLTELNERHHLCFDTFEMGKLTMEEYLQLVVFYKKRNFSPTEFREFIYEQSQPFPENISFFKSFKARHNLKVFALNNEAREINEYRIARFGLHELFDAFISSCYVKLRKPDKDIFIYACDLAQVLPQQVIMIDDRSIFVETAARTGCNVILFDNLRSVRERLEKFVFTI